jgi:hypothetical protein
MRSIIPLAEGLTGDQDGAFTIFKGRGIVLSRTSRGVMDDCFCLNSGFLHHCNQTVDVSDGFREYESTFVL